MKGRELVSRHAGAIFLVCLMAAYIAGYAWSSSHTDTADELVWAYKIRHGIDYPVEGPYLGGAVHLGPAWFYLTAAPLWIAESWLSVAIFIGFLCSLKFPLAYYCGRRLVDRDFGLLWAAAMFVPGWSTIEQLVFLNPNAVATAFLAMVALCLRGLAAPISHVALATLGLALALAIHVHPTSAPIAILVCAVLWVHYRRGNSLVRAVAALGAGFVVPFLPYIASQVTSGFADWGSASGYLAKQVSLGNIVNVPSILFNYVFTGPHVVTQYFMGWSPEVSQIAGFVALVVTLACLAASMDLPDSRRPLAIFATTLLLFAAWVACMRPNTPVQFVWVLGPIVAGLIALGLRAVMRIRFMRPVVLGLLGCVLVFNCLVVRSMTFVVRDGEGRLPTTILDIKDSKPRGVYRDVWFPALRHSELGEVLCKSPGPISLHGHLAYVVDKDLGLDTLFSCGERSRFVLVESKAPRQYFGMTRPFWRAMSSSPQCWVGSLGLTAGMTSLVSRNGIAVADGSTYLARRPSGSPPTNVTISVETRAREAVLLTNVLGEFEHFRIEAAQANGVTLQPVAQNDLSYLFKPPGEGATSWKFSIVATAPEAVDVVSISEGTAQGAPADTCALQSGSGAR